MSFQDTIHRLLAEFDSPIEKLDCLLPFLSPEHFEAHYPAMTELEREMVEALYTASRRFREELGS